MSPKEMPGRRAVIDIGTNSVKILLAEVSGDHIEPISEQGIQTRLGVGFYESNQLQKDAIARTLEAVVEYHQFAVRQRAETIRVIATSAVRDARNAEDLTGPIREKTGLSVRALSGSEEAEWAFRGVMSDRSLPPLPMLIVDLGGGSAEFIVGVGGSLRWRESFPIGTVRWLERSRLSDPPTPEELASCRASVAAFLGSAVKPGLARALEPLRAEGATLVGVGGAVSILARMQRGIDKFDRELIESARMERDDISSWVERMWGLSFEARGGIVGLPPERADVMLMGSCILEGVMESFGFDALQPSSRGLRFAALMD
ncbi:MAG: exopolyphosphatase/guanosine-5'-triphosphate,3'-diphosphate pyrophosphatase [Limisphaerales bacterium]|jgi:exopolyphosphatase/guanosine-5'-triphosphate,3'-diphosphate pyrophosphatase